MKTKRYSFYNLVEITLAMAAVAIGISGIMGLFVPAVDASREALAENNSSQSISTLLAFIEFNKKKDWDTFTLPATMPGSVTVNYNGTTPDLAGSSWSEVSNFPGIWATGTAGVYGLTLGENGALFCGTAQVWAESTLPDLYNPGSVALSGGAVRIHVRVSYPATLPDAQRKERFYVLEIARPQ